MTAELCDRKLEEVCEVQRAKGSGLKESSVKEYPAAQSSFLASTSFVGEVVHATRDRIVVSFTFEEETENREYLRRALGRQGDSLELGDWLEWQSKIYHLPSRDPQEIEEMAAALSRNQSFATYQRQQALSRDRKDPLFSGPITWRGELLVTDFVTGEIIKIFSEKIVVRFETGDRKEQREFSWKELHLRFGDLRREDCIAVSSAILRLRAFDEDGLPLDQTGEETDGTSVPENAGIPAHILEACERLSFSRKA